LAFVQLRIAHGNEAAAEGMHLGSR